MADLKREGDLAEPTVAADLVRRGYRVALPFRGPARARAGQAHNRQAGHRRITARSLTFTAGKVKAINRCTAETIDWLAAYETITLRPAPARNSQRVA